MSASIGELQELSSLIDLIYQGATDPTRWETILAALADYVAAPHAFIHTPTIVPEKGGYMFAHNVPAGIIETWGNYHDVDIYTRATVEKGVISRSGSVVTGEDLVPVEEWRNSVFFKEFSSKYDFVHMLGTVVFGTEVKDLMPTTCTYYRGIKDEAFSQIECQRQRMLMPHVSRSFGVLQRLQGADFKVAASRAALDLLKSGVFLIGEGGEVLFANRCATRILRDEDGLRLQLRNGLRGVNTLITSDPQAQQALVAALRETLSPDILTTPHFTRTVSVPRPSHRTPYALSFSSLPIENEFGTGSDTPRAIVFLVDPEQPTNINTDWLQSTFGLTRAETRVAVMLAEGNTMEEMSENLGVSVNTLRTQLSQIYAKTGVNTRARLVRLMLSLP